MHAATSSFDRTPSDAKRPLLRLRAVLRGFFEQVCEKASTLRYLEDVGGL